MALLAKLARSRPECSVLEMGIGTGRVALELHRCGVRVAGIDASEKMVAQLRKKALGDHVDVMIGDYATTQVNGSFSVVALLLNGIFDPRGRNAQIEIFRNAARHLQPGGYLVIESFVLCDAQRSGEWSVIPRYVADQHVELQFARYDIVTNRVERTLVHLRPTGSDFVSVTDTYASPSELDIMAEIAGFRLSVRYASWARATYIATSAKHVSVYQLADES